MGLGTPVLSGMKEGMNLELGLYQLLTPGQGFPFTQPACHPGALLGDFWAGRSAVSLYFIFCFPASSKLRASSHPSISRNPFPSLPPSTPAQPLTLLFLKKLLMPGGGGTYL